MGNDPTLEDVLGGLVEVAEGDDWEPSEAVAEAKEPGLNPTQQATAEAYLDEDFVPVDDSRTPTLAEKLAAGAELPWTFVLDGVQFVVKGELGEQKGDHSRWSWSEDGFHFTYLKYDDGANEVHISDADAL
jgi:hypothetical protein